MKDGLILLGTAVPTIRPADTSANAEAILAAVRAAAAKQISVLVLPELCLTGYTCGDLFFQTSLLTAARDALCRIARQTADIPMLFFVGVPLAHSGKLYNCTAALSGGKILGIVPKSYLPGHGEFSEPRHFAPPPAENTRIELDGEQVPFGTKLLFSCRQMPALTAAAEICEDLWAVDSPSCRHAAEGAAVIVNAAASPEIIGKAEDRRRMVEVQSGRLRCAYLMANAGAGESTTDLVFSGHSMIAAGGRLIAENPPFGTDTVLAATVDLSHLHGERMRKTTFPAKAGGGYETIYFSLPVRETPFTHPINPRPFVPADPGERAERCRHILSVQSHGLAARLTAARAPGAVVALSGGLDSCLALLVTVNAFSLLGRDPSGIKTVTMPCYGTTKRTKTNAQRMAEALGTSFSKIDITEAVAVHFRDIGHDPADHSVVFENCQARERTQVIMDIANKDGSLVIGTGDLSELALGWATYNGDHMSSYGVNAGVPKTLVRHMVDTCAADAESQGRADLAAVLRDILATPVSPELLPAENGEISQKTEDIVGPYDLHDFFLYRMVRLGENPKKIFRMACAAFDGTFSRAEIKKWLTVFVRRFITQQFKRSCLPDGVKIGAVSLSPRGDFKCPSDASFALWLAECDTIEI